MVTMPVLRWGERDDGQWRWHPRRCRRITYCVVVGGGGAAAAAEAELVCGTIGEMRSVREIRMRAPAKNVRLGRNRPSITRSLYLAVRMTCSEFVCIVAGGGEGGPARGASMQHAA